MPLYEYECESCGKRFELIRKFSDPPVETCFTCGGQVRKLLSSPAIHFKGTGWYITDYARKNSVSSDEGKSAKNGSGQSETKSETKSEKSETKSEKSETKSDSSAGSSSKEK